MECPNCHFDNVQTARYCGMCGTQLTTVCPNCSFTVPYTYRYCIQCGIFVSDKQPSPDGEIPDGYQADTDIKLDLEESVLSSVLAGEKRIATIIMADVKSSTDLMEDIGTEAWVEIMGELFQILETEIYRFGGIVDQFRGDGLVAFFGTDTAHEDDPERAVLAALSMQRMVQPFAENLRSRIGTDLSIRIGIHTGEVIVTSVGNKQTYSEDTAMGGAIAIAARLETAAEPGTILASERVFRFTESNFEWRDLGEIAVKGISLPVKVYKPIFPTLQLDPSQHLELSNILVGKEQELEIIKNCISDLMDGLGGIVLVVGERGMGKSLLVTEARRSFKRQQILRTEARGTESTLEDDVSYAMRREGGRMPLELQGRSRSYKQSQPYTMWYDLLMDWLGIYKDENKEKTSERLRLKTEEVWGEQWQEYYPYLAVFLSLPISGSVNQRVYDIDAESLRQKYFIVIRSWLETITQDTPLIITINDMHWADTSSLELLKYCLPLCDYLDILWILITRPDRQSPMWDFSYFLETEYPHRLTELQLSPLSEEESKAFITELICPDCLPGETMQMLVEQAEGNPYYIQELLRTLIEKGLLIPETTTDVFGNTVETWSLQKEITSIDIPDSLQSVLTARIDRLSAQQQQVLQIASVIGTTFWSKLIHNIGSHIPNLTTHITSLQRTQFISERGRVPDLGIEYIFKSNLIRDVVYTRLLRTQREAYHLQIAEFMQELASDSSQTQLTQLSSQYCSFVAHHYHNANKPEQELLYILKNAENSSKLYANAEAIQLYTHALQLIDQMESVNANQERYNNLNEYRFNALRNRLRINMLLGHFSEMEKDAEKLIPLAEKLANDAYIIDALLQQPGVSDFLDATTAEDKLILANKALDLSLKMNDKRREMESLIALVNLKLIINDPSWSPMAEQALLIAQHLEDVNYEMRLLLGIGGIYAFGTQPERSQEYFDKAANLAMNNVIDDKVIQMRLLNFLGLEYERRGDYYRLLTEFQLERLHVSQEIGHRLLESEALHSCGLIKAIYLGDYASGLSDLRLCRKIIDNTPEEVYALMHIAYIQLMLADYSDAIETLKFISMTGEPPQEGGKAGYQILWILYYNALGKRAATRSENEEVIKHLTEALMHIEKTRDLSAQSSFVSIQYQMAVECQAVITHLGLAQTTEQSDIKQKHLVLAMKSGERAYAIYQEFGYAQIVECVSEEVLFRYSQALSANGEQDLALRYLQRAYDEMITKLEMIPPDSHYRKTYLEQILLHQEIRTAYAVKTGALTQATYVSA